MVAICLGILVTKRPQEDNKKCLNGNHCAISVSINSQWMLPPVLIVRLVMCNEISTTDGTKYKTIYISK